MDRSVQSELVNALASYNTMEAILQLIRRENVEHAYIGVEIFILLPLSVMEKQQTNNLPSVCFRSKLVKLKRVEIFKILLKRVEIF